jgi:YebC/PmpR family DNA-binding regulatory protein
MAGHSKWANIKHRKGAQDAKRGKIFTKLIREITVAARNGGADLSMNSRLRLAVDKANGQNMPKDTIERAIKRGSGDQDGANLEEIRYEGYGPGGVAVMVDCLTDNRNRTVGDVRHAFTKSGGNLGTDGSVAYLFHKNGIIICRADNPENIMDIAIDLGASDVDIVEDNIIEITTAENDFSKIKEAVEQQEGVTIESAEISQIPDNYVDLDQETQEKLMRLVDVLEDLDDVQSVATNAG